MDSSAQIQPFGFDRVFDILEPVAADPEVPELPTGDLRGRVEDLEARIARMQTAHRFELVRAREDGFEAGLTQARSERAEAMLAATDALHAGLDAVEKQVDAAVERLHGDAGAVALHAAELLAGHAMRTEPARAIDEALGRALHQIARATTLSIRVNPGMRYDIETLVEARVTRDGRGMTVVVVEDANIASGDARIEWSAGGLAVDAAARRTVVLAEMASVLPKV